MIATGSEDTVKTRRLFTVILHGDVTPWRCPCRSRESTGTVSHHLHTSASIEVEMVSREMKKNEKKRQKFTR